MKLLQLNVWMGRLTRQMLPLIERERPDIITTQEMFSANGIVGLPDNTFHLLELMKERCEYTSVFFSPIYEAVYADVTVGCGNAILSKFPFSEQKTIFTNGEFNRHQKDAVFESNIRNGQIALVTMPDGRTFSVVNHHGYWEPNPVGSEKTTQSLQKLTNEVQKLSGPIIFAGDLNINPGTPAMQLFNDYLTDLTATHNITDTMSVLCKVPGVAPDHILVNEGVVVKEFRVLDDLVSDHKALVLDFEIV